MRRIVEPAIERPASICWPNGLPVHAATVAVRETIVGLITEQVDKGAWKGVTLRRPMSIPGENESSPA